MYFKHVLKKYINDDKRYDIVFTIGCFDMLHIGHEIFLTKLKNISNKLVVGIHDSKSISNIKNINILNIQNYDIREKNVLLYADDVFLITGEDPTDDFKKYYENMKSDTDKICFIRADDNIEFPGKEYISKNMKIEYVNYTDTISSTLLRNPQDKITIFNRLLKSTTDALNEYNIPYYLDCGTLLGCIRDGNFMNYDTDVDITVHLSYEKSLFKILHKRNNFSRYGLKKTRYIRTYPNKSVGNYMSVKLIDDMNWYCDIYFNLAFPLLDEVLLNGNTYTVPKDPELYIEQLYGKNWRIPSRTHADHVFHRNSGLINSEYKINWDKKYKIYETKF